MNERATLAPHKFDQNDAFNDLPGLKKAFTTKHQVWGGMGECLPDYVILDRSSPKWQWDEVRAAKDAGLIEKEFVEIGEQETELRYRLTADGRAALGLGEA